MKQQSVLGDFEAAAAVCKAWTFSKKQMRYEVGKVQRDFWQTFFTIMLGPSSKRVWAFSHSIFFC